MASVLKGKVLGWRKRRGAGRKSGLFKEQTVRRIKLEAQVGEEHVSIAGAEVSGRDTPGAPTECTA